MGQDTVLGRGATWSYDVTELSQLRQWLLHGTYVFDRLHMTLNLFCERIMGEVYFLIIIIIIIILKIIILIIIIITTTTTTTITISTTTTINKYVNK